MVQNWIEIFIMANVITTEDGTQYIRKDLYDYVMRYVKDAYLDLAHVVHDEEQKKNVPNSIYRLDDVLTCLRYAIWHNEGV